MQIEQAFAELLSRLPIVVLFLIIAAAIYVLARSADLLVDEAVTLSLHWGVPKSMIGATIVSLGTTLPEAAVSVMSAVAGFPGLALGNAVGSIIADTGLILGLAVLLGPVPVDRSVMNRQGWIKIAAGIGIVVAALPYGNLQGVFTEGGRIPQFVGFLLLACLVLYVWRSIRTSRGVTADSEIIEHAQEEANQSTIWVFGKLIIGIVGVVVSSRILIPTVQETAMRLNIPDAIIAATLVAFGTSLPELVTAVTAVRKGHGEIALGNIIGADILNVLFVTGAAAAVTSGGLKAPPYFFLIGFPTMLVLLAVFRVGLSASQKQLSKGFGILLLALYVAGTVLSYFGPATS
jgi:cation:H+ antiporter